MRNKVQSAFDAVHANQQLKDNTRAFLAKKLYSAAPKSFAFKGLAAAAACAAVLLFCGGYYAYFTPVSAISIDVNPSIELGINRFSRVVSVKGYNEDGEALVSQLSVKHQPYRQAVESILGGAPMQRYLAAGELLSVTVAGGSPKQSEQMLTALAQYTTKENITCRAVDAAAVADAHSHGLSMGKYAAYLALAELDPAATVEEIQGLTMRQIRDRINAASGREDQPQGNGGGNSGQGGGHGQGNGHGYRGGRS